MNTKRLKSVFNSFSGKNILIIGDVMVDGYIWGRVDRISPEAPVPIVSIRKRENRLGGAANVALNIKSLEACPIICSVIGDDDKGQIFLNLLKKREMTNEGIVVVKDRQTTSKIRVISGDQQLLRVDEETTLNISESIEKRLFTNVQKIIKSQKINAIIFQDYDKGVITPNLIQKIVNLANKNNIPTTVDPKKKNFNYYKKVTLFKPNFNELLEGAKIDLDKNNFEGIFDAAIELQTKQKSKYIFITLSELGVFITDGIKWHRIPAQIRDIADVSGAGDTVISVATLCLASNLSLKEIAEISNLAGGLVCEKVGVVPIDKTELMKKIIVFYNSKS